MKQHATAPAKELEVKTSLPHVSIGLKPASIKLPRPDLSGLRVKLPGNATPQQQAIYLMDPDGYRRHIPNPTTYTNLFRSWDGIVIDIDIDEIAEGSPLTDGAILARADQTAAVYLVSNEEKRWITSVPVMDKYFFDWDKVLSLPHVVLDFIRTGRNWS